MTTSSKWNDAPPQGGPMVKVDGFPGPLYPPDHAKGPSPKSGYVVALKRTAARLGAWPWDPDGWDEEYSNRFAHGDGWGDATHAGIAGLAALVGTLDATGNLGEPTFNFLRSAKVQEGRQHAGEMAMDSVAVNLINDAYADAQKPPASSSSSKPRDVALAHHKPRLGYTEQPPDSNCDNRSDGIRTAQDHCANGTWLRYEPWCGCWCYYALEAAGVAHIDSHLASVASIEDAARSGSKCYRGWSTDPAKAKPGDLVIIGGYGVHVEMVRAQPSSSSTPTYGGNTSPGTSGSQSNGGGVYSRTRYPSEVRGYALVRYPGE